MPTQAPQEVRRSDSAPAALTHGAPSKAPALLWRRAGARRFAAQQRHTRTTDEVVRAPLVRAYAPAAAARAGAVERRAPAASAREPRPRGARVVAAAGGQPRARGRTGARFQWRPSCDSDIFPVLSLRPSVPRHVRRPVATFGAFEVFGACASRCFTRQLCLAQRKQAIFMPLRRRREQACWAAPPARARAASRKAASAALLWAPARWWRRTGGTRL